MKTETLKEQAQRIKEETAYEEEHPKCEKCGEETRTQTVGDESYNYCPTCKWTTH